MIGPRTILAFAVAYVLGARAGRDHYDAVVGAVRKAWDGGPAAPAEDAPQDQ